MIKQDKVQKKTKTQQMMAMKLKMGVNTKKQTESNDNPQKHYENNKNIGNVRVRAEHKSK
jgi:hypothetical protein